jgi:hypothetical protein
LLQTQLVLQPVNACLLNLTTCHSFLLKKRGFIHLQIFIFYERKTSETETKTAFGTDNVMKLFHTKLYILF